LSLAARAISPARVRGDGGEIDWVVQDGREQHEVVAGQHSASAVRKPPIRGQFAWQGLCSGVKTQGKLARAREKVRGLQHGIAIGGTVVGRPVLREIPERLGVGNEMAGATGRAGPRPGLLPYRPTGSRTLGVLAEVWLY
jgi:hypothetical protein